MATSALHAAKLPPVPTDSEIKQLGLQDQFHAAKDGVSGEVSKLTSTYRWGGGIAGLLVGGAAAMGVAHLIESRFQTDPWSADGLIAGMGRAVVGMAAVIAAAAVGAWVGNNVGNEVGKHFTADEAKKIQNKADEKSSKIADQIKELGGPMTQERSDEVAEYRYSFPDAFKY